MTTISDKDRAEAQAMAEVFLSRGVGTPSDSSVRRWLAVRDHVLAAHECPTVPDWVNGALTMTATTETTKTMTIDGAGVSGDALHEFLSDVPGYALVQMRPAGGQMDPTRTTITARWSPRKREGR